MNVFIVTSCIRTLVGDIPFEDRYTQTLKTFDSIRNYAEGSKIIFCDSSIGGLSDDQKKEILSKVDHFLDYSNDATAQEINQLGLRSKSIGESYLLANGIHAAKHLGFDLRQKGRMFKLGGRCELSPKFNLSDYDNTEGKYVFKERVVSWMDPSIQEQFGSTHILETRLYSWSFSLVDEYLEILEKKNFNLMNQGFDTEHSHFLNIPKDKLLEYEMLNVSCFVSGGNYYKED
jgi:hypothetical protein